MKKEVREARHLKVLLASYCNVWIWYPLSAVECVIFPVGSQIFWALGIFVAPGVGRGRFWAIADLPTLKKSIFLSQALV